MSKHNSFGLVKSGGLSCHGTCFALSFPGAEQHDTTDSGVLPLQGENVPSGMWWQNLCQQVFWAAPAKGSAHMDALIEQGLKLVLVMYWSFAADLLCFLIPALTSCWVKAAETHSWIAKFLYWGTKAWKGLPKQWPQHARELFRN